MVLGMEGKDIGRGDCSEGRRREGDTETEEKGDKEGEKRTKVEEGLQMSEGHGRWALHSTGQHWSLHRIWGGARKWGCARGCDRLVSEAGILEGSDWGLPEGNGRMEEAMETLVRASTP